MIAPHPTADAILERRRLRRRLFFWRLLAVGAVITLTVFIAGTAGQTPVIGPHIARYSVEGLIMHDPERDKLLEEIAGNPDIKALVVTINSPGGTTVGSEALYESLRRVAENKPVVAVMSEVAASGGYITAIGADYIVARGNTITASIGVIAQSPKFGKLMEKVGVDMLEVRSGDLKAQPSPFSQETDQQAVAATRDIVADSFDWFLSLVQERRNLEASARVIVSSGRIVTGRQALELGLVDEIGAEHEALMWLHEARDIASGLKVVDKVIGDDSMSLTSKFFEEFFESADKAISNKIGGVTSMPLMSLQR